MWVSRPEEARLREVLAGGAALVTVHGLGGMGASSLVARVLGASVPRVSLRAVTSVREATRLLREVSAVGAASVFVDDVDVRVAPAIDGFRRVSRVVVTSRAPLGLAGEVCVPLPALDATGTRWLLVTELERAGVQARAQDIDALAEAAGGWPPAVAAAARWARVLGAAEASRRGVVALDAAERRQLADVLDAAWRSLPKRSRALLSTLALAHDGIAAPDFPDATALAMLVDAGLVHAGDRVRALAPVATLALAHDGIAAPDFPGATALAMLVDAGLVHAGDRVRALAPVAAYVRSLGVGAAARRAHATWALAAGERARALHRRDPAAARIAADRVRRDLVALVLEGDPRTAVRAALALEPFVYARLGREDVLALLWRAYRAAGRVGPEARNDVALALARTLIQRGEHESAERVLAEVDAQDGPAAVYRRLYAGHIAAWRGEHGRAEDAFAAADRLLRACAPSPRTDEAREDALLQRLVLAHRRGDADETARAARRCADHADSAPSPRLGAIARSFAADVLVRQGEAARAVSLLERSRDELAAYGDDAAALVVGGSVVTALRAAGDHARADVEARAARQAAARSGEPALELLVLGAAGGTETPWTRVADLAWRVQIPLLRERARQWLASRPRPVSSTLRLDRARRSASLDTCTVSLARRPTLWRALELLADAHRRATPVSTETLFAAGWPGERAAAGSRRRRVQTAVWTLRKLLLGAALRTLPDGYALDPDVRVTQS